ncbi:MAG: TIGR03546 family protein [Gemmatimonadales bacterium]
MLTVVKLLQSLVKALHSEGTPGQLAAGIALGAILGLTPLVSLHNAVVFGLIVILNVSFPAAMLGWAVFVPVGFLLDPLFDRIGRLLLLDTPALTPLWTALYNTPVVPLTNFNNTVALGSLVVAVAGFLPLYFAGRRGVVWYRATIGARVRQSKWYRAVTASKLYNAYRLFRPES